MKWQVRDFKRHNTALIEALEVKIVEEKSKGYDVSYLQGYLACLKQVNKDCFGGVFNLEEI